MVGKRRGLSKGLESLLSGKNVSKVTSAEGDASTRPSSNAIKDRVSRRELDSEKKSGAAKTVDAVRDTEAVAKDQEIEKNAEIEALSGPVETKEEIKADLKGAAFVEKTLETRSTNPASEANSADSSEKKELYKKLVSQLKPGKYQPRRNISEEELDSLADSIKQQGMLQPIVAREIKSGSYEILAGERRWRAAQKAGLKEVPVIVKNVSDKDALAIGLIENIQRENLNPLEEAKALERLSKDFELSHQQVATLVGKSRAVVTNLLRILNLRAEVKMMLDRGELDLGHAKVLLALSDNLQVQAAQEVVNKQLSVRETEALVASYSRGTDKSEKSKQNRPEDPDIRRLQLSLSEKVGAKVSINHNNKGKGKIEIRYSTLDELEGILEHIN